MGIISRPSTTTDALVLRVWPCGETSAVASLLTHDHGYIKVIAKAARGPRSRLRPLIEPGRLVTAEFSLDHRRELQFLRGGEVDLDPLEDCATLERTAYLLGALELVDRCRPLGGAGPHDAEAEATRDLFDVCRRFIRMLSSRSCTRMALVFFAFEWELLVLHGMGPEVSVCVSCGHPRSEWELSTLRFNPAEGGVVCGTCVANGGVTGGQPLGEEALDYLEEFARGGIDLIGTTVGVPALARPLRRELGALLHRFLGYHLPGYRLPAALELLRARKDSSG